MAWNSLSCMHALRGGISVAGPGSPAEGRGRSSTGHSRGHRAEEDMSQTASLPSPSTCTFTLSPLPSSSSSLSSLAGGSWCVLGPSSVDNLSSMSLERSPLECEVGTVCLASFSGVLLRTGDNSPFEMVVASWLCRSSLTDLPGKTLAISGRHSSLSGFSTSAARMSSLVPA